MGKSNSAMPGFIIFVCSILGLLVAAAQQVAYDSQWMLHLYLSSADEVVGLQILTIVLFMLCGCVLAAITQK